MNFVFLTLVFSPPMAGFFLFSRESLICFFPITIGFVGFCFSILRGRQKRLVETKNVVIFYELLGINLRFGKSFWGSVESASIIFFDRSSKNKKVCKNVVMQQLKSSSSPILQELVFDLENIGRQKSGVNELIKFHLEENEMKFRFDEKKSIALMQFYIQSGFVFLLWLICITYLSFSHLLFKHVQIILISLLFILVGHFLSYFILSKNEFRI